MDPSVFPACVGRELSSPPREISVLAQILVRREYVDGPRPQT